MPIDPEVLNETLKSEFIFNRLFLFDILKMCIIASQTSHNLCLYEKRFRNYSGFYVTSIRSHFKNFDVAFKYQLCVPKICRFWDILLLWHMKIIKMNSRIMVKGQITHTNLIKLLFTWECKKKDGILLKIGLFLCLSSINWCFLKEILFFYHITWTLHMI